MQFSRTLDNDPRVIERFLYLSQSRSSGGLLWLTRVLFLATIFGYSTAAIWVFDADIWIVVSIAVIVGIFGMVQLRNPNQATPHSENAPWWDDYNWDTDKAVPHRMAPAKMYLSATFFVLMFGALGTVALNNKVPMVLRIATGIFAAICGVGVFVFVGKIYQQFTQDRKFGKTYIHFKQFPHFLGQSIDLAFRSQKDLQKVFDATFSLRYVEEKRLDREGIQCSQIYCDTIKIDTFEKPINQQIQLQFSLPTGEYSNQFKGKVKKYWELSAYIRTIKGTIEELYLIPIYPKIN